MRFWDSPENPKPSPAGARVTVLGDDNEGPVRLVRPARIYGHRLSALTRSPTIVQPAGPPELQIVLVCTPPQPITTGVRLQVLSGLRPTNLATHLATTRGVTLTNWN
jgi:hypothetical protein